MPWESCLWCRSSRFWCRTWHQPCLHGLHHGARQVLQVRQELRQRQELQQDQVRQPLLNTTNNLIITQYKIQSKHSGSVTNNDQNWIKNKPTTTLLRWRQAGCNEIKIFFKRNSSNNFEIVLENIWVEQKIVNVYVIFTLYYVCVIND